MNSPQSLINKQSLLLGIWLVSVTLSIVLYGGDIISSISEVNVCTYTSIGKTFITIVQPKNWLGIFTIFLTSLGLIQLTKNAISKWPLLDQYKWITLLAAFLIIVIVFGFGCK